MSKSNQKSETKRVNFEIFTLTYGALVAELVKDYDTDENINNELEKIGYNMGSKLVEDFLARSNSTRCNDLQSIGNALQKAFDMFMNMKIKISSQSDKKDEFNIIFENNPLIEFVEIPETHKNLLYSNIFAGAVRGALRNVQIEVKCKIIQDRLRGDSVDELNVKYIRKIEDVTYGDD